MIRPVSNYIYNKQTLGFRLDTREEIAMFRDHAEPVTQKIDNFMDYTWGLINTILNAQQSIHLHSDDWARTVYIDTLGVKTTDFNLKDEKKKLLVKSGATGTEEYFKWFDNTDDAPNK
jgi:NTE family protein